MALCLLMVYGTSAFFPHPRPSHFLPSLSFSPWRKRYTTRPHTRFPGSGASAERQAGVQSQATPSSSNSPRSPSPTPFTLPRRSASEASELVRSLLSVLRETAPKDALSRSLTAARAVAQTLSEITTVPTEADLPRLLRTLFERLGATYIKLGQFIASSPTLFPRPFVEEFQKCLDQTSPVPFSVIKKIVDEECRSLNRPFPFKSIDPTPLASASIAQVHSAVLLDGTEVVIKVQKPSVAATLSADLAFLYAGGKTLEFLNPELEKLSLGGVVEDIRTNMLDELDFEKEASNLVGFRDFLTSNDLLESVYAPRPFMEYSTKKMLTMEKLTGVSLLDASSAENSQDLMITALNTWTSSVLKMPFFHADLHAGNLLALSDGRVGFIDFGIVGKISPQVFNAVGELSSALASLDYMGMAVAMSRMGATSSEIDLEKFAADIERVLDGLNSFDPVDVATSDPAELAGDGEVTQILLDIVEVTESNGLRLPREFGLLVKQTLYFDRYLKVLAPGLDVLADDRVTLGKTEESDGAVVSVSVDSNVIDV